MEPQQVGKSRPQDHQESARDTCGAGKNNSGAGATCSGRSLHAHGIPSASSLFSARIYSRSKAEVQATRLPRLGSGNPSAGRRTERTNTFRLGMADGDPSDNDHRDQPAP